MAMAQHDSTFSASDLAETLFRHKWKLVWFPACTLLVGTLVVLFWPRTYRSEAKLFLQVGRESVGLDPTATTGQIISLQQSGRSDEIKSAIDMLKSRGVITRAVDQLGPDVVLGRAGLGASKSNPITATINTSISALLAVVKSIDPISDRERAVIGVEKKLKVKAERDSTVIVVQFDAKTPKLAQAVCAALVDVYKNEHLRIHRNPDSSTFFGDQRELLRSQLDGAMQQVRQAKNEMGLATVEGRRSKLEEQRSQIELESYRTEQELATAEARVADLEVQLATIPERLVSSKKSIPNNGLDLKAEQLYALQVKAGDLKARYSPTHPLVVAIEHQIREAEQLIGAEDEERLETTDDVNPIHRQLLLELNQQLNVVAGYKARLAKLGRQRESLLADLRRINEHEVTLDQLEREANIARNKYYQYSDSLEQARIDQVLAKKNISNVSVAQPATLAEKPVSPSKVLVGLATLAIALGGTGSLVMASERLDDRIRHCEEIEGMLKIPVLGAIPANKSPSRVLIS